MSNYAKLRDSTRAASKAKMQKFADGGSVSAPKAAAKKGTTVNINISSRGPVAQPGNAGGLAPGGAAMPSSPPALPPMPPMGQPAPQPSPQMMQAAAMGKPMMANGGRVKPKLTGGAGGAAGRLEKAGKSAPANKKAPRGK